MHCAVLFRMSNILHSIARFPYDERLSGFQWLEQAEREDHGRFTDRISLAAGLPGDHQFLLRHARCRPGRDVTDIQDLLYFRERPGAGSWYGPPGID